MFLCFWCRCENDALPDLMTLTPKVAFFINESDIIDIPVNKHGKSDNFFINLDAQKQLLFSAKSESLKQRVSHSFLFYCHRPFSCFVDIINYVSVVVHISKYG